jgi:hypothetical protein
MFLLIDESYKSGWYDRLFQAVNLFTPRETWRLDHEKRGGVSGMCFESKEECWGMCYVKFVGREGR